MRLTDRYRLWTAYLLITVFMLPSITRTVHSCLEESIACTIQSDTVANKGFNTTKATHSHHCVTCPICQFTLYSFNKTKLLTIDFHIAKQYNELVCKLPVLSSQEEILLFQLRAPPTQA